MEAPEVRRSVEEPAQALYEVSDHRSWLSRTASPPSETTYGLYPSGSIGEYGFDPVTSNVFDPRLTFDFMGYSAPRWVSPYTYIGLQNRIVADHGAGEDARRLEMSDVTRQLLYLNYRMHADDKVDLLPSFHLPGLVPVGEMGKLAQVSCDLLNAQGQVVVSHQCHLNDPYQDPSGPYVEFHEILPWHEDVATLRVRRAHKEVASIRLPQQPPQLGTPIVTSGESRESLVRLEWSGSHPDRLVTYALRFSNDGGQTWRGIAADLTEPRHQIDLDLLPGGRECRFQVIASADIRTSLADSESFAVPQKPRQAHILSPAPGTISRMRELFFFRGCGYSPDFETSAAEDLLWSSNRDGVIGTGYEVATNTLSTGWHKITLSVPDGMGGEASASVIITVER